MDLRPFPLAVMLIVLIGYPLNANGQAPSSETASDTPTIEQLLSRVPDGAAWQDLSPDRRADFQKRASLLLIHDRESWGLSGLQQKENLLFSAPTRAMTENIDRILSVTFRTELPGGFDMARDVKNVDLKRLLIRIYLAKTDERGFMLTNHPEFGGWDGMPVKELQLLDHEHVRAMSLWNRQIEDGLRNIPDEALSPLEKALRAKSYFGTRAGKHFDKPAVAVNGSMDFSSLYARPAEERPFQSDTDLLEAYNASSFAEFREVNVGTLDAFMFDHESEFNLAWLKGQGMSETLANNILRLGSLYRSRTQDLPEKSKRCTIFSPSQRDAIWDSLMGRLISNADGSQTMQSYARSFEGIIAQRQAATQAVGRRTLERLFPDGSPALSTEQRARVADRILRETRPAKMMSTLLSALDEVTGNTAASTKVQNAFAAQPTVGGDYSPGQSVRDADKAQILEMWNKMRAFIKREYSGYRVDIAALIPAEPIIVPTGDNQFAISGKVNLSLGTKWNLASLSSTIMHELKHAIDQNSHAAVEGAAWEGAATSVERQVWPIFIEEAMSGQGELLPVALLKTEIDNVRFTATTDATLKVLLRESCGQDEKNTIEYAEEIVRGYGYDDPKILRLRSRRAHRSSQYLEYDYGLTMYTGLLSFLQDGIGSTPRVDAFLLQACDMASPKQDKAAIDSLRACIRDRKS